jgi:Phosphotransferase enzyme family
MTQLQACRFPLLGNLYFADVWNQASYAPILSEYEPAVDVANTDIGIDDEFVVGRMVSPRFFRDKRLLLPAHRGPFKTALELVTLTAETKLLGQRTRHLSASPAADYYSEVDEQLAEDGAEVLNTFNDLARVMLRIFSATDFLEDVKVLWHDDLSGINILVNPASHKLTGVVDWESVSTVPAWEQEETCRKFCGASRCASLR